MALSPEIPVPSPLPVPNPNTAGRVTSDPASTPQRGESESSARLTLPQQGGGIRPGRSRFPDEDEANLVNRQAIQVEAARQLQVVAQVAAQSDPEPSVSARQNVVQTIDRIYTSQKRSNDTVRALEKLQRSCNHTYDRVSRRCLYCTKHRDSHVYDTSNRSVLS